MEQNGATSQEAQKVQVEAAHQNIVDTFKTWREAKFGKTIMAGQTPLGHILVPTEKKPVVAMFNDGTVAILENAHPNTGTADFDKFVSDPNAWSFPEGKTIEDVKKELKNVDEYSIIMGRTMSGKPENETLINTALDNVLPFAQKELEKRSMEQQDKQALTLSQKLDQFNPRKRSQVPISSTATSIPAPSPAPQPGPGGLI